MIQVINGVRVKFPTKLEGRLAEIRELVDMAKELAHKKGQELVKIHVWESSRHELCYADFTERMSDTEDIEPKDFVCHCYGCLCKTCVRRVGGDCKPCQQCGDKPKQLCPMSRVFDPRLVESAEILKAFYCGDNVDFSTVQSAIHQMLRVYESVKYFVEDERFEGKLVYDVTIENCPME